MPDLLEITYTPPLIFLISSALIIGITSISLIVGNYTKKNLFLSKVDQVFFGSILILSILTVTISYFLYFNILNIKYLKFLGLFLSFFSIFFLIELRNLFLFIKFYRFKYIDIIIIISLILYFLTVFMPASDGDSLDYHLGAPLTWINELKFISKSDWLMFRQYGYGEVLNFFGIANGLDNINSYLNFFFLLLIIFKIIDNFQKEKSKIIILFLLGLPINLFLFPSQKPMFYPNLIYIYLFLDIMFSQRIGILKLTFYVLVSTFFLLFKLSYIVPFFFFNLILFYKSLKEKLLFFYFFIFLFLFFIITFPIYFFNFKFYFNPFTPMFDNIILSFFGKQIPDETVMFSNYTKNYYGQNVKNYYQYFLYFFFNSNIGKYSTTLGLSIFTLFFLRKKKIVLNIFFILSFLMIIIFLFIGQFQARYYAIPFVIIMILVLDEISSIFNKKIIFILLIQLLLTIFPILFFLSENFRSVINKENKEKILSKIAFEFEENRWLKNNTKQNSFIFSDIRSKVYSGRKIVSYEKIKFSPLQKRREKIRKMLNDQLVTDVFYDVNDDKGILIHILNCKDEDSVKLIDFNKNSSRNVFNRIKSKKKKIYFKINYNSHQCRKFIKNELL